LTYRQVDCSNFPNSVCESACRMRVRRAKRLACNRCNIQSSRNLDLAEVTRCSHARNGRHEDSDEGVSMGRTRERAVYASDVVWVRMGSDVSRRRLPSGPRRVCRPFLAMDLPFSLCSRGSLESAQYFSRMCAAPHDRACAGTAALPARTQFAV